MKSIIQANKECYVCKKKYGLHEHHVFSGTANRKQSEKYGMKVWLCPPHHNMSNKGVHFDRELDLELKCVCQEKWLEQGHTKEKFISVFGKWWIRETAEPPQIF